MTLYVGTYYNYTPYGKGCKNTGYRKITGNGHKLEIQSGENGWYYQSYRDRESCIWGIHAPGARKLRVTLRVLKVRNNKLFQKDIIQLNTDYIFNPRRLLTTMTMHMSTKA